MTVIFKGGNNRQLGKTLEQFELPTAILDRRARIAYVNGALCEMVKADGSELVGKQTTWELPSDETAHGALLSALAPPSGARAGKLFVRRLVTPVVFGSSATAQLFVPILDQDALPHLTLVIFGDWETLSDQVPSTETSDQEAELLLAEIRGRWQQLDGLEALVGSSPSIQLAMRRSQLAIQSDFCYIVSGPESTGKDEVAKAIFSGRLKRLEVSSIAGQYFSIDCKLLDEPLVEGMLEVFAGRLRPGVNRLAQQLVFESVDTLSEQAILSLQQWVDSLLPQASIAATSQIGIKELATRGPNWQRFASEIGTCEVCLPALSDRCEDILPLAQLFLAQSCRRADRALLSFAPETQDALTAYPWPRNLQQLRESISASVNLAVLTSTIKTQHLPVEVRTYAGQARAKAAAQDSNIEPISLDDVLLDIERVVLRRAMKLSPRNRAQVARWLGISRPRLLRRLEQLGLDDKKPSTGEEANE